jgi:glucose-1-phosphate thymidylyltransferase
MIKKGVILCGGNGTRLRPLTNNTNKHLLPVYNKQMVLYPLQTLLDGGITDILIVTGGEYMGQFIDLLGSGSKYGCRFTYRVQDEAGGIAQALLLAEDFVDGDFVVILGDNYFENELIFDRPRLFLKTVQDANRFGVLLSGNIIEKPKDITIGEAVTGCYIYSKKVFDFIRTLQPSARGEMEITDVNNYFIDSLDVTILDGFWSDMGTFESLYRTAEFIKSKV